MATTKGAYIRVLYDYHHAFENRPDVTIKQGETYILLKKANDEWWSVKKPDSKAFFVPANYVEEIESEEGKKPRPKANPPKPPIKPKTLPKPATEESVLRELDALLDSELDNDIPFESNPVENSESQQTADGKTAQASEKESESEKSVSESDSTDRLSLGSVGEVPQTLHVPDGAVASNETPQSSTNSLDRRRPPRPPPEFSHRKSASLALAAAQPSNGEVKVNGAGNLFASLPRTSFVGGEPQYANIPRPQDAATVDDQSDEEPMYANIDKGPDGMKGPAPKPPPNAAAEFSLDNGWAMYTDPQTRKKYYYHEATNESAWNIPKGPNESRFSAISDTNSGSQEKLSSEAPVAQGGATVHRLNSFGTACSLEPIYSNGDPIEQDKIAIPVGWNEELKDTGEREYINESTNEKWLRSSDDSGRAYFYKPGTSESSWELPQVNSIRHGSLARVLTEREMQHIRPKTRSSWSPGDLSGFKKAVAVPPPLSPSLLVEEEEVEDPFEQETCNSLGATTADALSITGPIPSTLKQQLSSGPRARASIAYIPCSEEAEHPPARRASTLPAASLQSSASHSTSQAQSRFYRVLSERVPNHQHPFFVGVLTPFPVIREKKGMLNKTKVAEYGKKIKKNWSSAFVITTGPMLYFYKDQKMSHPKPNLPNGRPESTIELYGASVDYGTKEIKEMTSKKNVIQLTTGGEMQFLLQSDEKTAVSEWYTILRSNLELMNKMPASASPTVDSDPSSLDNNLDDEPSKTLKKKVSRRSDRPSTPDDTLGDGKETRVKDKLLYWLSKRPTKDSLKERGIYKDGVFGSHLIAICEKEKKPIPKFVLQCVYAVEHRGLDVDGIYRVSGNLAQIQKLRCMVDQNEKFDLMDPEWDVHVVAGAMKLFFRELAEPLFPFNFYDKLTKAVQIKDLGLRQRSFKELIRIMPKVNRDTMKELFRHFGKVIEHSRENRMESQSLSIVFGPTLMWREDRGDHREATMALDMVQQTQVMDTVIREYKYLF